LVEEMSVVIVTYNRRKDVIETIKSLIDQTIKPLEIIVIDDGSKLPLDLKLKTKTLKVKRFEKEVGLSEARNYGAKVAKGQYVGFIDDDAIAERSWVEEMQKMGNTSSILGGSILPYYEAQPPGWWSERDFGGFVGVGNIWEENLYKRIWGTNIVIKKEVFEKIGFFNPNLGRQKGKLLSCEENDFIERARKKGLKVQFMPKAVVYHKVKSQRMTLGYILRRSFYAGKSQKIQEGFNPLRTSFDFLQCVLILASPRTIFSPKVTKIKKIVDLAHVIGVLF
jgi:glucosyl-dolichyl phosphate glucuronosyltransferase